MATKEIERRQGCPAFWGLSQSLRAAVVSEKVRRMSETEETSVMDQHENMQE